jgi:hypothetical protein
MLRRVARLRTNASEVASYGYVPSSPILVTLMMEGLSSSETSVLTSVTQPSFLLILSYHVKFEVFTAVGMKIGVFCDVTPCGSCKNRRFGGC